MGFSLLCFVNAAFAAVYLRQPPFSV
ncbi:hypothetical protein CLS_24080 [[Clostridium] cf. saccharolyticum K10]|nr:hypothetical protein CLS_24080 [[Clostridium] cf. saccharolyticum K10]